MCLSYTQIKPWSWFFYAHTCTRTGQLGSPSSAIFRLKDAEAPTSAIKLCPQAWPMLGNASYSHKNPTFTTMSPSLPPNGPQVARNAVSKIKWLSTFHPGSLEKKRERISCACFSWYASSGQLHISWLRVCSLTFASSTTLPMTCFNFCATLTLLDDMLPPILHQLNGRQPSGQGWIALINKCKLG